MYGPYTVAELRKYAKDGRITAATEICRVGTTKWVKANQVRGLGEFEPSGIPASGDAGVPVEPAKGTPEPIVAETAFADFIARYPDNARIGEASYRLGQTLTARKATADAAGAYIAAIRGYPKTTWAPDAMLELSRALVTLGDRINACKVLSDLDTRYPTVPAPVKSRAATTRAQAKCTA